MEHGKKGQWWLIHKKNITSQNGEDGIISKIFELIEGDNWCVEVGAWDGKYLSNTYNLIANEGWSGILIEPNKKRYNKLIKTHSMHNRVFCLNKKVGFNGKNSLDNILKDTLIPKNFDLLSIDVDGIEYHIWASIKKYHPKVVIVEFNYSIPNDIVFIQQKNMNLNQGSSLLALTQLGKKKNYELVAITYANAIYVEKKYYKLFGLKENSLDLMYDNISYQTRLFQLYDGTLVLVGCDRLLWHGRKIYQRQIQVLPKLVRKYPLNYTKIHKLFLKLFNLFERIKIHLK